MIINRRNHQPPAFSGHRKAQGTGQEADFAGLPGSLDNLVHLKSLREKTDGGYHENRDLVGYDIWKIGIRGIIRAYMKK